MVELAITPDRYRRTVDAVTVALRNEGWQVTPYGVENLSSEVQKTLRFAYNITNLYVRTRPDLLVCRDGMCETFLFECKDLTETGQSTGNLSVEAVPWFIARHLRKMNIRYLYAIDLLDSGTRVFRPDMPPFSKICIIHLPNVHEVVFKKEVLSGLKAVFPKLPFELIPKNSRAGSSQDPFILIPLNMIIDNGRTIGYFAKWGWR